jgi:histidinol-phosphate/aromatic aminotransferase/cobyric acid decarboxylase-like protein
MVQLCNPNNPTGLTTPGSLIRPAVASMAAKTTVVVDEAYIELTDDESAITCVPLVKEGKVLGDGGWDDAERVARRGGLEGDGRATPR